MHSRLGLAAAVLVAGLVPASASATTFSGSCDDIAGTATFEKPLTSEQAANHYDFSGSAHCTGTVNGAKLDKAPVTVRVGGDGNLGCAQGEGKNGIGTITLSDGRSVGFLMDFTSTASEVDIKLRGAKSGSGTGSASFFNQTDPAANFATLQNCGPGGAGNKSLAFTAKASVPDSTPLDDGKATATESAPAQSSPSSSGGNVDAAPTSGSQSESPAAQDEPKPKAKHKAKKKPKKRKHKAHKKHRKQRKHRRH
jgi:hypothetical protein